MSEQRFMKYNGLKSMMNQGRLSSFVVTTLNMVLKEGSPPLQVKLSMRQVGNRCVRKGDRYTVA